MCANMVYRANNIVLIREHTGCQTVTPDYNFSSPICDAEHIALCYSYALFNVIVNVIFNLISEALFSNTALKHN